MHKSFFHPLDVPLYDFGDEEKVFCIKNNQFLKIKKGWFFLRTRHLISITRPDDIDAIGSNYFYSNSKIAVSYFFIFKVITLVSHSLKSVPKSDLILYLLGKVIFTSPSFTV